MGKTMKKSQLDEGLLKAMHALDQQIARSMERSPTERELEGVQKWGPYSEKVEQVSSLVLNALGDEEVTLDSLVVLSQAFSKALKMVVSDLGGEGLGKVRSGYCQVAFENINRDASDGMRELRDPGKAGFLT